ncbi:MAG TPA: aldo/keto reductase [Acidobacteriaceae bacterium]|nr:aldo/keto reductase [Acidobacteriaceae bacterium]
MPLLRKLGRYGPEAGAIGLGTFSFSHAYGRADSAESLRTLNRALELGCTLVDTADSYGAGENERWLGRALEGRRNAVVLGTKVGLACDQDGKVVGRDGRPETLRCAIDASLKRLRTDVLDLCTLHRIDPAVPVEESIGAMAEAVAEGKVRLLGLSEVEPAELLRANTVHSIAAVQSEFALWTREPEHEMIPLCEQMGAAFVAFSPLGRGLFAAPQSLSFEEGDFRRLLPRFQPENLTRNVNLAETVRAIAARRGATASQVALAWVLRAGPHVFAIVGTRSSVHLEENLGAQNLSLTSEEIEELNRTFAPDTVGGERYAEGSIFGPNSRQSSMQQSTDFTDRTAGEQQG